MSNNHHSPTTSWLLIGLTLLFVYFKIEGKIGWSWWMVFAPVWGPFVFAAALITIYAIWIIIKNLLKR